LDAVVSCEVKERDDRAILGFAHCHSELTDGEDACSPCGAGAQPRDL
jgi:hypothetical protein